MNKGLLAGIFIVCTIVSHPSLQEHSIKARDGHRLHTWFLPTESHNTTTPTIFWVHGLGEYTKRHLEVMVYLRDHGFSSIGFDMRGHGQSDGNRGYIHSIDTCGHDLEDVYHFYQDRVGDTIFLVGNSLGGLVSSRYLQRQQRHFDPQVAVLLSPAFGFNRQRVGWFKQFLIDYIGWMLPWYHVAIKAGEKENPDKNLIIHVPIASVVAMSEAHPKVFEEIDQIKTPLYILAGGEETIVDLGAMYNFHAGLPDCCKNDFTLFSTMPHCLLAGNGKYDVYQRIKDIFKQYLP